MRAFFWYHLASTVAIYLLTMLLKKDRLQYINSITHGGKVVLFGTDSDGKVWYTIKQDGFEDSYLNTPPDQRTGWEDWQELEFPDEPEDDASVVAKELDELTYQETPSQFILRSRYRTQSETAVEPVQLVSGMQEQHLYVFRQSKQNTLLCDRYVLDGIANTLVRKLQVRFKRSSQRFKPSEEMKQGAGGLKNVDSLDYRDANGNSFYEPTTELSFIKNLHKGWFSVVQLPTIEHDKYRWHIFAYNSQTKKIDLYSLRVSQEGLFDVQDYTIFEPKSEDEPTLIPRSIPGLIKRTLDLNVQVGNGISATKYFIQTSRETKAGTQLMRDATKVMLAIVTADDKVAPISFAALGDGTLSEISDTPTTDILRSNIREILLPLNTLDKIQAIGLAEPPPEGKITALNRAITDGVPHVQVTSAEAAVLKTGQEIIIAGNSNYDGHYTITKIDDTTFEIDAPWVENGSPSNDIGSWKVVPPEEQAVVFDGLITGYEITTGGKLRVKAENHGLENGDEVQIFDTASYDGTYSITKVDDQNFTINDLRWQTGEAVNLKLQSHKRRGIVFDGQGDYIQLENQILPQQSYTVEVWLKLSSQSDFHPILFSNDGTNAFASYFGNDSVLYVQNAQNSQTAQVEENTIRETETWFHLAITYDYSSQTIKIYKNGQLKLTQNQFTPRAKTDTEPNYTNFIGFFFAYYQGEMADFRIWKVARTAEEIKNSMHLQLTGREVDLVGYWRLGGIAVDEDNQRKVIDFSVNNNDGIVYGDLYVSAVTLNRKLGDGTTDAVQYSNNELFAVNQRATYLETFEFKVNPTLDPNNIAGEQLFNCTYWGQKSHRSTEQITFAGENTQIEAAPESGWYKASCRFTVPDEVNLVRSFEISDVIGSWDTLEIRKQRIHKISDTITEASYTDNVALATLSTPQGQLPRQLEQLQQKELEEQTLLKKKKELEEELASLEVAGDKQTAINNKQTEINNQNALISSLEGQVSTKYTDYQHEQNQMFNYWCKISCRQDLNGAVRIYTQDKELINTPSDEGGFKNWNNQYFKFEKISGNYYAIICKYENRILDMPTNGRWEIYGSTNHHKNDNQQWQLNYNSSTGYYQIKSKWHKGGGKYNVMDLSGIDVVGWDDHHGGNNQQWKIEKIGNESCNNNIENARQAWENKKQELQNAKDYLERLKQELAALQNSASSDLTDRTNQLMAEISAIENLLEQVQQQVGILNTQILNFVQNNPEAQTMPEIATQGELATTGAILDFINPVSRLTSLETAEGMVQLSYVDRQGKLRQGIFDATADEVNAYFEQWLPDQPPICLNCDSGSQRIALDGEGLNLVGDWTIEANFIYPFPGNSIWNTLTSHDHDNRRITVEKGKYLGTYISKKIYYCLPNSELNNESANAYDMSELSQGWHHLAVVGTTVAEGESTISKTIFYIDGYRVGECNIKSNKNIQYIGNVPVGGRFFGKFSEVRIWNTALKETEIAANSQVYLTGNEPGLIAYYRLNEATGTEARDYTGNGHNGSIIGANWWGCTKTLAAPISQVMSFDGNGDYLQITYIGKILGTKARTVEAWIQTTKDNATIASWGNNSVGQKWVFRVQTDNGQAGAIRVEINGGYVVGSTVVNNGIWHHVACTFQDDGSANVTDIKLYVDGNLENISAQSSRSLNTTHGHYPRIGRDSWDNARYFSGQMAEVRIWSVARTQTEIKAHATKRLTGKEEGLELCLPLNNTYTDYAGDEITTKVVDLAKGRHGRVYNALLTNSTPKVVDDSVSSLSNSSNNSPGVMMFGTQNDYIDCGSIDFARGDYSIETWFKTSATVEGDIFTATKTDHGILLEIRADGTLRYLHRQPLGSSGGVNIYSTNSYNDGKWHHLVAVKTGASTFLYVDGAEIGNASTPQNFTQPLDVVLGKISKTGSSRYYQGYLAEFRIWNIARSQADIQAAQNQQLSGQETGLVAYWRLDTIEAQKVHDLAGNHDGTTYGTAVTEDFTFPLGNTFAETVQFSSEVMIFDGVNDYINVGNRSALSFSEANPYTIEAWINPEDTGNRMFIVSKWNQGHRGAYKLSLLNNQKLQIGHNVSPWSVTSSGAVETGKFNHIAVTYDGSVIRIYINGQPSGAGNLGGSTDNVTNVLIGADHDNNNPSNFFKGKMSEVRIWKKARSQAEIEQDMNQRLTGNEANLVGYWRLDDLTGNTVTDLASGFNGTVAGSPYLAEDKTFFEYGSIGTQIAKTTPPTVTYFDGDDYIDCGSMNLSGGAITISAWVKVHSFKTAFPYISTVAGIEQGSNAALLRFGDTADNDQIQFVLSLNGNHQKYNGSTKFQANTWYHIAATYNGSRMRLYVNGQEVGSGKSVTGSVNGSGTFYISRSYDDSRCLHGEIAEVQAWTKALSATEIKAKIYQRLNPSSETSLEGYWTLENNFLEGTTRKTYDVLGNHHGTLTGTYVVEDSTFPFTSSLSNAAAYRVSHFDGENDYLNCGSGINLANQSFTIEFWAKRGNTSGDHQFIVAQGTNGTNKGLHAGFRQNNRFTFAFYSNDLDTPKTYTNQEWHHWSCTYNSANGERIIYCDGKQVAGQIPRDQYQGNGSLSIGQRYDGAYKFTGEVAEVRIWNYARSGFEVQLNYKKRLTGEEPGLLAYYPLNQIDMVGTTPTVLDVANNHNATPYGIAIINDLSLPVIPELPTVDLAIDTLPLNQGAGAINYDTVVTSVEYGTFDIDPISKQKSAMMRRMFAYLTGDGVETLQDKRIENLELVWIGNAQFAPTLLGYIEGAPPVPSENLNIDGDYQYNGATSVELTITDDVEYSWNRSQDAGLGGSADIFLGVDSKTFAGIGVATSIEETHAGFKGTLDFSYQWLNESNVASSSSLAMTDRLELRGAPEVTPKFPHYGRRFIPKNIGYALVVSSLADLFITRLSHSQKMVGYEVRPVEDIPPDVNTITFLMNPAYVMNGSLDGLVGSSAANEQFYGHVPEMRSQYGSLYPASYFRLIEAYNLKQQIEKADKERLSYFENFNSNLVDETSLNRQAGDGQALQSISLNEDAETIDVSGEELTEEEKQAQLDKIQEEGEANLEDVKQQGEQRKQEIKSRIDDIEQRTHALESFAGWQKTMENILVRSGKRNIVNTYVWDADGGLRMEEQSFASTTEHTIGGSFTLSGGLGFEGDFNILKASASLTALVTTNMTQTMTKTQANSRGMELNVDLSGIEPLGITDENDIPYLPGEKVDRFRMMSFYLESSTDNYLDFFNYVVDPEWLASNDEEARALRQVQSGKPNKTWRVLHRVTYVERPALLGFGRDARSLGNVVRTDQRLAWVIPANATVLDEVKVVLDRVEYLEKENKELQSKIDQILNWVNSQQP